MAGNLVGNHFVGRVQTKTVRTVHVCTGRDRYRVGQKGLP